MFRRGVNPGHGRLFQRAVNPDNLQILLILSRHCTYPCASLDLPAPPPTPQEVHAKFAYVKAENLPLNIRSLDLSGITCPNTLPQLHAASGLTFQCLDNIGTSSGNPITIFNGERYTRAEFRLRLPDDVTTAELETSSPASISRPVDTPSEPFDLRFNYRFETTTGELTVSLNGTPLLAQPIPAPDPVEAGFSTVTIPVPDTLQGLSDAELKFEINGPAGSKILVDNIVFPLFPELLNENFADETLDTWPTQVGTVGVLVVESPEDATIVVNKADQHGDKFNIKGNIQVNPDPTVSDGINMPEDVKVVLGDLSHEIPAAAFSQTDFGYQFNGAPPGIRQLKIFKNGKVHIKGDDDLSGIDFNNPVFFSLRIGNDLAQTEIDF
jgi:hypothetical protein